MGGEKKTGLSAGKTALIILGAVVGVGLLIFGSGLSGKTEKENADEEQTQVYDEKEYEREVTEKIRQICSRVRGAGEVSVAITLNGSFKALYAQDVQSGTSSGGGGSHKSEYVLTGSGSSEKAVLIGYSPPEIKGVGIVCEGGNDAGVRAEIISLVSAAFGVPTNKIYVAAS